MKLYLCILCLLILPMTGRAQVLISEVAWMGTDESATNEWIEIYNFSTSPTDLTGWTVTSADGKISISLKCTLAPHGMAVLERTDETTLPDITALLTYKGDLVNGGTTLTIKDPSGNISNEAVGGESWSNIGGTNTTPKQTPQQTSQGWITAPPTPMGQLVAGDAGTSNVTCSSPEEVNEEEMIEEENNNIATVVTRPDGGSSSKKIVAQKEKTPPVLSLTMIAPKIAYVHQEVDFEVVPSGVGKTVMSSLAYTWNFGDTYTETGKKVQHTFEYPGEYVVIAHGAFAKQEATIRQEVKVLPVSFTLSRMSTGDILLKNGAPHEVDLAGFVLRGTSAFTFPKFTIMKAGGALIISKERVGGTASVSLFDTQNVRVATDVVEMPQTKVISPIPVLSQNIPAQPLLSAVTETTEAVEEVPKPQETIIQIGNTETVTKEEGLTKRFIKKFASIFGF